MARAAPMHSRARLALLIGAALAMGGPALAGPPYVTDDPQPTDPSRYEIYLFDGGTRARDDTENTVGIDFNYGAAPNLQLTAVVPFVFEHPQRGASAGGPGNIELAAKYRIVHAQGTAWNVAVFPRLFLPAGSSDADDRHASLLLPVWVGTGREKWSTFGGGGCEIHRGGEARDFCLAAWALTHTNGRLQFGAEIYQRTADTR
ncbi:MAG: transporter, partial [Rhodanobacteraceae bacterium]